MNEKVVALLRAQGLDSMDALKQDLVENRKKLDLARINQQDKVVAQLEKKIEKRERLQAEIDGESSTRRFAFFFLLSRHISCKSYFQCLDDIRIYDRGP
jgi:hypothetical protein